MSHKLAQAFFAVLFLALSFPSARAEQAQPAMTNAAALSPEEARRALETIQDDRKRAQMIDTLRAIANASGPQQPATPAPAQTSPIPLSADGLGAQLLLTVSEEIGEISSEIASVARTITHFPAFYYWIVRTANDPAAYNLLIEIAWKLALVLGCALVAEWVLFRLIRRPVAFLEGRVPQAAHLPAQALPIADPPSSVADVTPAPELHKRRHSLARVWQVMLRLPPVFGRLVLELLPVLVFVGVATALLGTEIGQPTTVRLVILAVVNAYAFSRGLICVVRALAGPFGLFPVRAETAAYVEIWARRIVGVGITGIAFANVALLLGLHRAGYAALLRMVMLIVHLFVVVIILQCRRQVAEAIRAPADRQGIAARLRNRIAGGWHYLAIALDLALWAVWALNIRNGYSLLLQYFVGTIVVAVITRLAVMLTLSLIDRGFRIQPDILQRFPGLEIRANRYLPLLRKIVSGVIVFIGLVAVLEVWGVDAIVWFYGGQIGSRLISALVTIGLAVFIAAAIWEASNALLDRQINTLSRDGHYARAARLRTFQPMLRTALLCLIATIVGLTALSEIGVNVAPLLAGAGIVGIAIGFGSQKLVQDLITGLFLLLENTVQVGDNVSVSGLSGTVENVSIRTIRLRAGDGAVHIVPFSAVTTITNASRGAGNASVSVNVAYREDTDRAGQILKDIVDEMRREPEFRALIRGDLDLWGIDKVDGAMVSIVGQIRCTEAGRWPVQREFNRRMKLRFQQNGINIASATQTILMHVAPPADGAASLTPRRAAG
ncbi:small-conductance mechanosensitive channel [Bradyrhizobium sp. WBOS7]|uniref:Small-conductance mechanosensitive channel n=1 Tax=Bradyrhizobium betae TaxID=244734 RepID=A0AAE9NE88_9BRAD|nr:MULTISPECIES: mechanosensitive ion channel domain-containing protein [Bradyrhizobium]MDD1574235.1 small-conductance mechanosensitive channel [Bradyrhizobium sp. WBOS1]UUO39282.1 small-conductance mechanosensitive channel [Bradyrhizobium sp. WBOS01]MDD1530697.1 small-conductance mechanosensitive channel [Bradyrhizobium sp. WBOS2]MDD1580098.1 small-conductance mechanosensitive channel [Bradyrhizobium sp. WBOS7]MDD1603975.1 small-conductance mechanosensitive channel [Bradyrhizobium sp. WBOS16]